MCHKKLFFCLMTSFISILIACKKENNSPLIEETGSIAGAINVYDDKTNKLSDASGFTVSVIGNPGKIAVTNANGQFKIDGLPFDNYDLSFSKIGYGTYKIFGIEHLKKSNLPAGSVSVTQISRVINLGALSTTSVSLLSVVDATYNDLPGIEYSYVLNPAPTTNNRGYVRAFLGKKSTTTSTEYTAYSAVKSALSNNVKSGFTAEELYGLGFESGDSVYVKLYGESYFSNQYIDPGTGKAIFPNLNAVSPSAIGFLVP